MQYKILLVIGFILKGPTYCVGIGNCLKVVKEELTVTVVTSN